MRRSSPFRRGSALVVLVLTALLAAPAGAAPRSAARGGQPAPAAVYSLGGPIADWLLGWWLRAGGWGAGAVAGKGLAPGGQAGCIIGPHGHCAGAATFSDNGCSADPDGRCAGATANADNGCSLDPSGRCGS